ncbi:MAG: LysE family transporter [Deltaproteobacteria bacterium]|nr:LysE family transporter [Deltaproteobacteria bacterium]
MKEEAFRWGPFLFFTLVQNATPGPNVILLASSGGLWGFRRTLPHLAGICLGFPLMLLLVIYGSDRVFKAVPWLFPAMTVASLAYVAWLAVRIVQMGLGAGLKLGGRGRPMSFLEAVAFQWINGKAWQIALMAATLFATSSDGVRLSQAAVMAAAILVLGSVWIELGKRIAGYLKKPLVRKLYYATLAVLLLLATWPTGVSQLLRFSKG